MVTRAGFLAGAGALAVSGCGTKSTDDAPGGSPPERSVTSRQGDVELLQAALKMEDAAGHREHVDRLSEELRARGAKPALPWGSNGVEPGEAIAFYVDMLPKVYDADLRTTIASILVVESQQLAVDRLKDGQRPAPDAFVYGFQPS